MKAIVLDTNAYSELMRGNGSVSEILGEAGVVIMTPFVIGELEAGFRGGSRYEKNKAQLREFLNLAPVRQISTSPRTPELFGELKDALKRSGVKVPVDDVWIAAMAKEYDAEVLTFDEHFAMMVEYGVKVGRLKL